VTAHALITARLEHVNIELVTRVTRTLLELLGRTQNCSPRELEEATWEWLLIVGNLVLTALLTRSCADISRRKTLGRAVKLRLDANYTLGQSTTVGPVQVPLFAYRDELGNTRAPARSEVFPLHPHCRSSEMLLEWETRLGSQLPFRQAENALEFFTHGAATIEDNTIARHLRHVARLINHDWTCRPVEQITKLLETRATRDARTGRPLLYVSSDAHALKRFVDDTWTAEQKMLNGLRFWCIDKRTGQTLHLGGDYTFGDCREVARRLAQLVERVIPKGKNAPQVVFIGDGMPWFVDHLFPLLPKDTQFILDFWHFMKRVREYAAAAFGAGTKKAKAFGARAYRILAGKRRYRRKSSRRRRGHKKKARSGRTQPTVHLSEHEDGAAGEFLDMLSENLDGPADDALLSLIQYAELYVERADYPSYRQRGMQIGSGAMESFHRCASQMRLKLSGARWTAEQATAVLKTRLMMLAGQWDAFWSQAGISEALRQAFTNGTVHPT